MRISTRSLPAPSGVLLKSKSGSSGEKVVGYVVKPIENANIRDTHGSCVAIMARIHGDSDGSLDENAAVKWKLSVRRLAQQQVTS